MYLPLTPHVFNHPRAPFIRVYLCLPSVDKIGFIEKLRLINQGSL
ncbi:hypothetical protein IAD21_03039 [Abditibacteriota bacterium]|nr:hypothetical protein IAD21_03039 [Abditibacteriota bacterium]